MRALILLLASSAALSGGDTITIFGRDWSVPVGSDWKVEGAVLTLGTPRGPRPGPRRPIQFALTRLQPYERLTIEADVKPLDKSLLIVFAFRDEAHFDYAHLSVDTAVAEPVHNGIFHVYGGERVRISSERGPAAFRASKEWYHLKLEHDAKTGTVEVAVDGVTVTALHAVDLSLGAGGAGLGSFDETAEFKHVTFDAQ